MLTDKICVVCNKPLGESQMMQGLKSCPHCSQRGAEHVFYAPLCFGFTALRSSAAKPDGPQSWCTICRSGGWGGQYPGAVTCNEMVQRGKALLGADGPVPITPKSRCQH